MKRKYSAAISLVVLLLTVGLGVHILRSDAQARWPTNVVIIVVEVDQDELILGTNDDCSISVDWMFNDVVLGSADLINVGTGRYVMDSMEDEPPPGMTHFRVWNDIPLGFNFVEPQQSPEIRELDWGVENGFWWSIRWDQGM